MDSAAHFPYFNYCQLFSIGLTYLYSDDEMSILPFDTYSALILNIFSNMTDQNLFLSLKSSSLDF